MSDPLPDRARQTPVAVDALQKPAQANPARSRLTYHAVTAICCGLVGFTLGSCTAENAERSQAIAAHVGQYVFDPSTRTTEFVYGVSK